MMKAIAIDDEPLALEVLKGYCEKVEFIHLEQTFTKTTEAKDYSEKHPFDLLFLDIRMPAISGIDFFKNFEKEVMVIFTTAYSEYAIEGFNLNAIDYLLKPFEFDRFLHSVNKAREYYEYIHSAKSKEATYLFVQADYRLQKIVIEDILYIEGMADYLRIHLLNRKPVVARMTMKDISQQLPSHFMRVHRSYIVPLARIESVRNKTIFIHQREIPVGKTYFKEFITFFGRNRR